MSGGGTGGHINPALAIAGKIKSKQTDAAIAFVGTARGMESTLVPKEGYELKTVKVRGFQRRLTVKNIDAAVKAVTSVMAAKNILKEFKPDLVIGTGGYVSWPVGKAAASLGIPLLIHEQNAVPGVTTKMLAHYADKILISFDESRKCFDCPEKLVLVGNPVKAEMLRSVKQEQKRKLGFDENIPLILSYGGSLGAARVNETALALMKRYSATHEVYHLHAVGKGGWPDIKRELLLEDFQVSGPEEVKKGRLCVREYIYNMPQVLSAADLVICRAGAMTLAELACLGKAAVIIPSPNVTNDHQYKNAHVLEQAGAAVVIREKDLTADSLITAVSRLIENKNARGQIENKIRTFAITDSLERIYRVIESVCRQKQV